MSFGISNSVMSRVVQVCTPELFHQATRSSVVKDVCSQIADALESKRRGEMNNEDFETLKTQLKKRLPILTPHATFRNGRRCNSDAIPSGFSIYDIDHIPNPRGYWEEKKKLLAEKRLEVMMVSGDLQSPASKEPASSKQINTSKEPASSKQINTSKEPADSKQMISVLDLIVLVHVTPSSEGLRLVFIIPDGMSLADAQKWMSQQLGDEEYDVCVKDLARPSFIVPEDYILFINNEELFKEKTVTYSLAGDCKSPERMVGSNLNVQSCNASYPPPPPMPGKLPKLVELLISKTPEIYQPAVAHAIFPPLATHLWNTRFRYIDNVEHEATLMTCLLAGTGAGKSCVQMPISMIMEDIRKRDQENLKREKEWKEEMMRKGANKDKRKRPDNLIIQEIDADMTNPAFVMRTAEAKGHFLYTSLNEIDQFDALKGIGNQHFRIMCLAFDPGNQYGQTRVGTQSVTERVTVRFNWNASTTIQKGQRYFSKVLTDGPLSRINFCTIPEREIGDKIPVYGTYDDQFRKELKPYIENLCMATGLIDCPEAYHLAEILSEENADFSQVTQNRIYENFTFRANVIAYLKACVLYVANGCRWEPEIEDFIRWSERYDLWCKMRFFEEDIQKANNVGEHSNKRGPSNLLQSLPDTFTEQQVVEARAALGLSEEGTAHLLSTWVYRKYVKRGSENYHSNSYHSFTKLKYRCDGQELS